MKGFALHVIHETMVVEEQMLQEIFASLPPVTDFDAIEEDKQLFENYWFSSAVSPHFHIRRPLYLLWINPEKLKISVLIKLMNKMNSFLAYIIFCIALYLAL